MIRRRGLYTRPTPAAMIRKFAVPIIILWVGLAALVSLAVPSLEQVARERAVSLSVQDAPSLMAMKHIGEVFGEANNDSVAMVLVESDQPLGADARRYYDDLIRQFRADPTHIKRIQDFWSDPLTAKAAQSADGKAAIVQLNLAGNQGEVLANESVDAVRDILARTPAPDGVKGYVTGPTPLSADLAYTGDHAAVKITIATVIVISIMLLLVYRSIVTVILVMAMMGIGLTVVRGVIATLGQFGLVGLSSFAISILVALAIAATTDYAIFFVGRYHEARQGGQDRETAYFTAYRGVAHVILASGLTIAGATFCLSFTRLPIFQTMGVPCAVGMVIAVAVALTLIPAVVVVASRFGLLDPRRTMSARGWRRIGTAIVRWPVPVFVASCFVTLIGLLALPGYQVSYEDRPYMPADTPANIGWAATDRHFSESRMMPETLMVESDHDLRNSADLLVLNKLAQDLFKVEGVAQVQGVTRPEGAPLEHTSIPFMLSMQTAVQQQNIQFVRDRLDDMRAEADNLDGTVATMRSAYSKLQVLTNSTQHMVGVTQEMVGITNEIRGDVARVNDSFNRYDRIFNSSLCGNIATCEAARSGRQAGLEASNGMDQISSKLDEIAPDLNNLDTVAPQLVELLPGQIDTLRNVQKMLLTTYSTMSGILGQVEDLSAGAAAMGQDFDAAQTADSFYLPREALNTPDFRRVMGFFLSPDGKAARFIITHRGNPASAEGIARIDRLETAAAESLKGTPLANSSVYVAGTAAVLKDLQDAWNNDLLIAGIASLGIVFIIIMLMTRSLIAALVIVGTVVVSLAAAFGLSVLVWQHILGINLHWMVLLMAVIILLAVGADYNLLLVSRFKEELGAGLKTGMIRAMGGTGKSVTLAGLVFAFTMASMMVSDLLVVGQVGTTVALGLVFDTLVVRAFLMPSAAVLLGRWFWWPMKVRMRPTRTAHHSSAVDQHPDDPVTVTFPDVPMKELTARGFHGSSTYRK